MNDNRTVNINIHVTGGTLRSNYKSLQDLDWISWGSRLKRLNKPKQFSCLRSKLPKEFIVTFLMKKCVRTIRRKSNGMVSAGLSSLLLLASIQMVNGITSYCNRNRVNKIKNGKRYSKLQCSKQPPPRQ